MFRIYKFMRSQRNHDKVENTDKNEHPASMLPFKTTYEDRSIFEEKNNTK